MIKPNQLLLPVLVLIATGLLIAGAYILLSDEKPSDDKKSIEIPENEYKPSGNNNTNQNNLIENISDENPYIEETNEVISPENIREMENDLKTTPDANLTPNTKPKFNVGDKFVYERMVIPATKLTYFDSFDVYTMHIEYHIIDAIRVGGIYYFKVQKNRDSFIVGMEKGEDGRPEPVIVNGENKTLYINADTGETFIGVETNDIQKARREQEDIWFRPWMLALDDNIKWRESTIEFTQYQIKSLQDERGEKYEQDVDDFYVEGREKIEGKECFKVIEEDKFCSKNIGCKIENKKIYYIDVEGRILVKFEHWWQNLRGGEMKLIN